jgi:hypothetical protein
MATSGVYNWPLTAGEIVQQAMIELGVLNSGDDPDTHEMTDCMVRFNAMLKGWSRKANLWRDEVGLLLIPAGQGAATLQQAVRDINSVRHVVSPTNTRLLAQWTREQYYSIPNRQSRGNPSCYYVKRDTDSVQIYVWPVPQFDITLHADFSRAAQTITEPGETIDISQEFAETVILGLAARISGMFGASRIDQATVADVKQRAAVLEQEMYDSDRPDSITFEPWTQDSAYA